MLFFAVRERCAPPPQQTEEHGLEAVWDPGYPYNRCRKSRFHRDVKSKA
jgi:hypothetical protein